MPESVYRWWWELDGDDLAREVESIASGLRTEQRARTTRYLRNLKLFECLDIASADAAGYYRADVRESDEDPLGLLRSAVQTAAAEIYAKQKPKPQFLTSGADWATRRRAKKLDKICEGVLHQRQGRWADVWSLMHDAGIEAETQGVAPVLVLADDDAGKIEHEIVPVHELYVDPHEGREPRSLFRVSPIAQESAMRLFCAGSSEDEKMRRAAIIAAQEFDPIAGRSEYTPRASKRVRCTTAWHIGTGDKPGKCAVSINGVLMSEEDWTAPAFPFVFLRWENNRLGFWGTGLVDEGARLAHDAGDLDMRLLRRARICGGRRIFVREDSVVNKEALEENDAEVVIEYTGEAPPAESLVPPFTDSEFQFAQAKIRQFWDAVGVSQVSAAARREPGVESAVAMRTLNDTKSGRQLPRAQAYERAFVELAYQHIYRMREMSDRGVKFEARWAGKNAIKSVKWSEADPGDDANFSVVVAPASALPNDPAGRLSMAGELFASKLIDATTYKQLLGWPDLEQELNQESAEFEYIDDLIERYLDARESDWSAGDYESPEGAIVDKPRALLRFTSALFQAKRDRAPEFNTSLLRRYIQELGEQISASTQAQQPQGPPPGTQVAPPAGPMPAEAQR